MTSESMTVDIWSDIVCPWCYLGKRRFEKAASQAPGPVQIVHRSFQLNPQAPAGQTTDRREMLREKYRLSNAEVEALDARMVATAAADGLDYHLDGTVTGNTLDAHRLTHLARDRQRQDDVVEALFRAYFTESRSIFDAASLVGIATGAGLDAREVESVLRDGRYGEAVAADLAQANAYGISGVPFFVIDGRYGVSGAQSVDAFGAALARAWAQRGE